MIQCPDNCSKSISTVELIQIYKRNGTLSSFMLCPLLLFLEVAKIDLLKIGIS